MFAREFIRIHITTNTVNCTRTYNPFFLMFCETPLHLQKIFSAWMDPTMTTFLVKIFTIIKYGILVTMFSSSLFTTYFLLMNTTWKKQVLWTFCLDPDPELFVLNLDPDKMWPWSFSGEILTVVAPSFDNSFILVFNRRLWQVKVLNF